MRNQTTLSILLMGLAIVLIACEEEAKTAPEPAKKASGPIANPQQLAAFLPAALEGLARQSTDIEEIKHNRPTRSAKAVYAKTRMEAFTGPDIKIEITDMGRMARTMASLVRNARDSSFGGQTTRRFEAKGFDAVEQTEAEREEATVHVLVTDQLMVELTGRKIGADAVRAALERIDLAGLRKAADSGLIAEPTEFEKIALPGKKEVGEALPTTLFGKKRITTQIAAQGSRERPFLMARIAYTNGWTYELRFYKDPAHALADRPMGTDEKAVLTHFGYTGNKLTVREESWKEESLVVVQAPLSGNQAQARTVRGTLVIEVRGENDPAKLKQALDALDLEALRALAVATG